MFTQEQVREYWGNGKTIEVEGTKYDFHRMSYGDYFLEPITWTGGETDGFSKDTIWLEKVLKANQYGYKQVYYKLP